MATVRCLGRLGNLSRHHTRHLSTAPSYSERMAATGRPVSPHVTIYAFPTIAISSITVRLTGVALTLGSAAVGALALAGGPAAVQDAVAAVADSPAAPLAKWTVAFPLAYHYLGGVRHAVWDLTARGFSNRQMLLSSYALFGASGLASVALAAYSLPKPDKRRES